MQDVRATTNNKAPILNQSNKMRISTAGDESPAKRTVWNESMAEMPANEIVGTEMNALNRVSKP